jgi:Amt family ammonium transporter
MIFFMQLGFAMLECGSIRQKNANSILIKNLFDACVGCIAWWLIGFAFAFGNVNGGFIGYDINFFASNGLEDLPQDYYLSWVFHFAFACTSATIVSGALAERT